MTAVATIETTPAMVPAPGGADARVHVLLAHGAGAGMASPFMTLMADMLAARGITVHRFEFAYMAARAVTGKSRPPPKAELLVDEYRAAVVAVTASPAFRAGDALLIGGKSMGGRVASLVADEHFAAGQIVGLVCLGYPFHPPKTPDKPRTAHLAALACPALVVQGERDPFGPRAEVEAYALSRAITLHWVGDGDHDLGPRGASGFTRKGNLAAAADAIRDFAWRVAGKGA